MRLLGDGVPIKKMAVVAGATAAGAAAVGALAVGAAAVGALVAGKLAAKRLRVWREGLGGSLLGRRRELHVDRLIVGQLEVKSGLDAASRATK